MINLLESVILSRLAETTERWLLLEDTPGNYGIILFAQTELLANLALAVNEDLQSRITYSALLLPLTPEDIEAVSGRIHRVKRGRFYSNSES